MKTFKLVLLEIVNDEKTVYETIQVPLTDGLIINKEDDRNSWLIEAYTDQSLFEYFTKAKENNKELIVHVKITTEQNDKATCLTKIIGINEIGEMMNVLFDSTMIEDKTVKIEKKLKKFVAEGFRGEALLEKFKEQFNL